MPSTRRARGARKQASEAARNRLAADLKRRYDAGASIRELAELTGRSYGFVHRMLSEAGADIRGRGGATRRNRPAPADTESGQ
ncbi:helix-turn-helix domain-containing protein [Streptomyces sp. NEAU-174]|uniref:helix-turn-helix domain-containing protein n=1 Tax=Streptomyces sp. NEAU-174 TaxID=3458254 RepID=UPI004044CC6B